MSTNLKSEIPPLSGTLLVHLLDDVFDRAELLECSAINKVLLDDNGTSSRFPTFHEGDR